MESRKHLFPTGLDDNVLISRKSANGEISSIIPVDVQDVIRTLPFIAKNSNGTQIISNEPVVVINLEKNDGGMSNITVRGVSQQINLLRPHVKLVQGNWFNSGTRELIVGTSINNRFGGAKLGDKIKFAGDFWEIVGIFEAEGSGFESEFWGDAIQLSDAFNRYGSASTVTLKLDKAENFDSFKRAFENDRRLQQYEPKVEKKYFEEQSELLAGFIRIVGIFITVIFSMGATIGATITMYSAVANRTVEIGTLRALGFRRTSILIVFLFESLGNFVNRWDNWIGSRLVSSVLFNIYIKFCLILRIAIFFCNYSRNCFVITHLCCINGYCGRIFSFG